MDYERIDFKTGQVLTADALNHMQEGIEKAMQHGANIASVAYTDLVSLRDEGKLTAGTFYRITDYMTTTAQFGTLSAGHQFDVIVLALSKNALAEEAYAVHSERDTEGYFANSNLSAWKLWYSLDNDTAKFAWADAENGKGVIYRMIDEFNNDIPYDFKNIMYSLDDAIVECEIQKYGSWFEGSFTRDSTNDKVINNEQYYAWFYNVTAGPSGSGVCYTKEERISVDSILYNDSGSEFSDVKLLSVISEVYTFGMGESADLSGNCYNNSIGVYITFGKQELNRIIFGEDCYDNTFGNNCYSNIFGNTCQSNTFGNHCSDNASGVNYQGNTFGDNCTNNTFGNYYYGNTFGNNCTNNTFGNHCRNNTFGNSCHSNTFGNSCISNTFGNSCDNNSFRSGASENAPTIGCYQHNHFDDGCSYNVIWSTANLSEANPLRNININRGVCGKSYAYNYINIETLNPEHEINVNQIDGIVSIGEVLSIRHASLKSLRDNGQLIAGQQYRIIDYVTTTSQENTQSAGHKFDLIVTANDAKTLCEKARAIQHEGDTYFADSNLESWEVWYCLDNDSERFAWASTGSTQKIEKVSKGEETFTFAASISHVTFGSKSYYLEVGVKTTINAGPPVYVTLLEDGRSLLVDNSYGFINSSNYITVHFAATGVIYRMIDEFGNDCPYDFKNIQFKRKIDLSEGMPKISEDAEETWVYTFAATSYHIDNDEWSGLKDGSLESPYGHMSDEETSTFHHNVMKPWILNYDGDDIRTNCGKAYLNNNVMLGYWDEIGSANDEDVPFYYAYCGYSNTFGINCHNNTFGTYCQDNTFGNYCQGNIFGNGCNNNTFGNNCYSNTFGSECIGNDMKVYYRYITFGDGVRGVTLQSENNGDATYLVQNYRVASYLQGNDSDPCVIPVTRGNAYETIIARNSDGDIVRLCLADLVQ